MAKYEKFLNQIAEDLDLTETEENSIIKSYNAIGEYLTNCKELSCYEPQIFPQGSIRLGTIIKPLNRDDYDIDLVCQLNSTTLYPEEVKRIVGSALKNSRYSNQIEEEHGRCWTLDYSASPPYHIDILPGISMPNEAVKATVKKKDGKYKWLFTNPKKFADWFISLKVIKLEERFNDSVEKVNVYSRRNILQRAVQLIKRHRDVFFKANPDKGPASVIITALTGLSYSNEQTIENILLNGPIQWLSHIRIKEEGFSIKIPTLQDDDYADKWNEDGKDVVDNFLKWHRKLLIDLDEFFKKSDYNNFLQKAKEMFSDSSVDKLSNSNIKILDDLKESFGTKNTLIAIKDVHPLFNHARMYPNGVSYMPISTLNIKIVCRVYEKEEDSKVFNDKYEFEFYDYSPILSKNKHLAFRAVINNTSQTDKRGYHVKWQITNSGSEAGDQLRGEFIDEKIYSKSVYIHNESTLYSGTHFIQLFVLRYDTVVFKIERCIAKSKMITVNIGA